jgi:hypothetical protein
MYFRRKEHFFTVYISPQIIASFNASDLLGEAFGFDPFCGPPHGGGSQFRVF